MRRVVSLAAAALVVSTGIVLGGLYVASSVGVISQQQLPSAKPPESSVPPSSKHVFLIMMENKPFDRALQGNYAASLASKYALATNYHAITHPSLPNYLALTSGSTWGTKSDNYQALPSGEDLGSELTSAGIPWRAYMESMTNGCFDSPEPYALKHNPFAFYGEQCPSNVVSLSELDADLSGGNTPNFVWVTPNLCHDEHNCNVSTGDQWLAEIVPKIMDSAAWKDDGVLFIVWDEDDKASGPNQVPLVIVAPGLEEHQTDVYYDHYSLLATIEDRLGVPRLGEAANAQAIEDFLEP
ncbi:MAG TPA: alkaline phosphatase family protein [Rubrobacteraceae bacterium]|jgi:phospholipase C|nr:alkaline phosphatase family protein [Rubrobacteraceae bacterium]